MKDVLARLVADAPSQLKARNVLREYLQARVLARLQREGAMIPLAFHGGTALRFLYSLPRHSENLDFSLEGDRSTYDLRKYAAAIESEFRREAYEIETRVNADRTVQTVWIRFSGLLHQMKLSNQSGEIFSLKLEVDTRPPKDAGLETTIVRRYVTLQLQHHDRPSLLAGKLHAILQRPFTKGRDLFDLMWYLSDPNWPAPNLKLLNDALSQTAWTGPELTHENWRHTLAACIREMDWRSVRQDVAPFIERRDELAVLSRQNLMRVVEQK